MSKESVQISATVKKTSVQRVNKIVDSYAIKTSFSSMVDMLLETGLCVYERNMGKLTGRSKPFNHSKK